MSASTAIAIATMTASNAANNNHHHHHYSNDGGTVLLALVLAILVLCLLWIVFTSIRQLVKKDPYYDFVDNNIGALIITGVIGGLTLLLSLAQFIYILIK